MVVSGKRGEKRTANKWADHVRVPWPMPGETGE